MKKDKKIYPTAMYPFDIRITSKGFVKNSSGWNRDDTKDIIKLVIVALVVVVSATVFGLLN
jgi:hypothetical protein